MVKNRKKANKGITLIALVITIIVLLILAGISIATLTGENGVLTKASTAQKESEIADAKEQAKLDIATYIAEQVEQRNSTELDDSIIQGILTGKDYVSKKEGQPGEKSFKTRKNEYEIFYSELYQKNSGENKYSELKIGDYVNYPVEYENVGTFGYEGGETPPNISNITDIPVEKYNGWRILSVEDNGENSYVRLISTGIPLNFYNNNASYQTSLENLTTKFWDTSIENTVIQSKFIQCGFKDSNGKIINNIITLRELFCNNFTDTYKSGESASYTDSVTNINYINNNVLGYPKVQSMTKDDIEVASKNMNTIEYVVSLPGGFTTRSDLFHIPSTGSEGCHMWIASSFSLDSSARLDGRIMGCL